MNVDLSLCKCSEQINIVFEHSALYFEMYTVTVLSLTFVARVRRVQDSRF